MAQHTIDLPCIADTYVDGNNADTNYGTAQILKTYRYYYGSWAEGQYTLLKFDNSVLPKHKKIISTKLRLYMTNSVYVEEPGFLDIDGVRNFSWDEYTLTFQGFPSVLAIISSTRIKNRSISANVYNEFTLPDVNPYNLGEGFVLEYWTTSGSEIRCHSRENINPPTLRVVYEDVPPDKPTLISPIGEYKDSFATIRFEWDYNSSVGGEQKKFDLRWSTDQETWTTISQTTSNTYYDAPGGTFPTGNIYWQVRTYNEYDEASEWSDIQSFYAVGAPNAPTISSVSAGTARPTISWVAFDQQVYRLQILSGETLVYDSGDVPGINIRSQKIPIWLADGEYTARIRIKNEYDLWSDWGSAGFTITTTKPDKPSFSLQRSAYGVEIHIQDVDAYALIYRSENDADFICIGKTTVGYFYDCSVGHGTEYRYFVRSVSANETYADSDVKLIQAEIRHSLIAPISDMTDIFEFRRSLNAPPKRNYTRALGGSTVEYEGRKYPVFIPDEHVSAGLALTFFLHSWSAVEKFIRLYDRKETVLYRDARGRKIFGVLSGLSVEEEREGYTISFLISQVDYSEEVEV